MIESKPETLISLPLDSVFAFAKHPANWPTIDQVEFTLLPTCLAPGEKIESMIGFTGLPRCKQESWVAEFNENESFTILGSSKIGKSLMTVTFEAVKKRETLVRCSLEADLGWKYKALGGVVRGLFEQKASKFTNDIGEKAQNEYTPQHTSRSKLPRVGEILFEATT